MTIASTTVKAQRVKLGFGDDGTYTGDVSRSVPLPVDAALNTGVLQSGGSQLTPKFARVQLTADADIVAAVTGKKIRVLAMTINSDNAADDLDIEDASGGTVLFRALNLAVGTVNVLPFSLVGWFETTSGNALYGNIALTGTSVNLSVVYVEV